MNLLWKLACFHLVSHTKPLRLISYGSFSSLDDKRCLLSPVILRNLDTAAAVALEVKWIY